MTGSVARRYARALFALAREEKTLERTGEQVERLAAVAADPDLASTLENPLLNRAVRMRIAETLAEQLSLPATLRNFVCLLAENGRLGILPGIGDYYRRFLDEEMGRVRVRIQAPDELDAAQRDAVVQAFRKVTGKQVLAESFVDAELLGGLVVEAEGKVYDGSVRTQLERLAARIAGGRHI